MAEALRAAEAVLSGAGVPSPRADAELLAAHLLGIGRGELQSAAILGRPAPAGLADLISRRAARIPLQHLTGLAPFRGLDLAVGPGVFVPRPETEEVAQVAIDAAVAVVAATGRVLVVDLCTGSGAIALAVAHEVPGAVVHAVELDAAAHAWAARNVSAFFATTAAPTSLASAVGGALAPRSADAAGSTAGASAVGGALAPRSADARDGEPAGARVVLHRGDARTALRELDGTVDVVVANPPYVPPGAIPVDPEVAQHDPAVALYGLGRDGLEVPRGIVAAAARLLRPGGLMVVEHAEVQAAAARAMVDATGRFSPARTLSDLTGRARMVLARRSGGPGSAPSAADVEHSPS